MTVRRTLSADGKTWEPTVSKVEEVARAMEEIWNALDPSIFERPTWRVLARAAIAAMREPTDDMRVAIAEKFEFYMDPEVASLGLPAGRAWQAAIDVTLAEHQAHSPPSPGIERGE